MTSRNRGKPKPKLRSYGHHKPSSEEKGVLADTLRETQDPIAASILGQNLVEIELDALLRERLQHKDDETWLALCETTGPISSFGQKIRLAHALGCINSVVKDGLDTIRTIRNGFAHSKKRITFNDELIIKELMNITLPAGKRTRLYSQLHDSVAFAQIDFKPAPMLAFKGLCLTICGQLLDRQIARTKARGRQLQRKEKKAHMDALARVLFQRPSS